MPRWHCGKRHQHLLKTFWVGAGGWHDEQLADGTVIWTAPDGLIHVTRPGSRLLFRALCQPTAPVDIAMVAVTQAHAVPDNGLTMPPPTDPAPPHRRSTTNAGQPNSIRDPWEHLE